MMRGPFAVRAGHASAQGEGWCLARGDWQEAIDWPVVDALITDPPYGARTHAGHNAGAAQVLSATGQRTRASIAYDHLTPDGVDIIVDGLRDRVRGWWCVMTSHDLVREWGCALERAGRYVFAPLPIVQKRPRLLGDGPSSWTVWMVVARPRSREWSTWGSLPGAYEAPTDKTGIVAGAKPLDLMRAIVRDYTRPGDLVADPFAGGATTLLAAVMEGRDAIGAERDHDTWRKAVARLSDNGIQQPLFPG